jgi:hypothetical protein
MGSIPGGCPIGYFFFLLAYKYDETKKSVCGDTYNSLVGVTTDINTMSLNGKVPR